MTQIDELLTFVMTRIILELLIVLTFVMTRIILELLIELIVNFCDDMFLLILY